MSGKRPILRQTFGLSSVALLLLVLTSADPVPGHAQGSAGGTIGKQNKSASGSEDTPAKPSRPRSSGAATAARTTKCPDLTGSWNSWASGMFGNGDAVFSRDGTQVHRSGIRGKWFCRDGQLRIEWADGKPGAVILSADGKRVTTSDGGLHMSRN